MLLYVYIFAFKSWRIYDEMAFVALQGQSGRSGA